MTQNRTKKKSTGSLIKKLGLIIIGLFLLYVIAGFWVIPPLLKPKLEKELSSQIGRKVTIEEIKLNPLVLSATTTNLTVYEKDGEPFAGFKELLVDAELSSIVRWALTFKEIRLIAPFSVLKVLPDNKLNISDILTKFSQTEPTPEEEAGLPRALISNLQVEDGKFTMQNLTGTKPITETYSPITFTLNDLSTLVEHEGAFKFTGVGPLGGNYQLDGQVSVNPVRVQGSFSTTGTNLSQSWKHIEDRVSFQIKKGATDTSGNYSLEIIDGTLDAKLQEGVFELKDFELSEKGKDKVLISIPYFSVQGISADVKTREIFVEQIKTDSARIDSWLAPDGILNLQSLLMPDSQKSKQKEKSGSTEPKPAAGSPWQVTIHKIEVNNWGAVLEDRTLPKPARITIDDFTVSIENLENKKNSKAKIALALQINKTGTVKLEGSAGIDPLSADIEMFSDKIALKSFQPYVDTAVKAQIASGTTSSKGRILYQGTDDARQTKLQNGAFELKDFSLTEKDKDKVLISIPSFSVQGVSADVEARAIDVKHVKTAGARIETWIDPDGTFNLQSLLKPDSQKSKQKEKSGSTEPKPAAGSPWQAIIHKIEVSKWGVAIEDRTLPKPVRITVDDFTVGIENLENKKNSKAKIALALQINKTGTVKLEGSAGIDPLSADIEMFSDKIALKPFQPYVDTAVKAQIASGTTSSKGRIIYQGKDGQPQISYQGELSLDGLKVKDRIQNEEFISQKQIKASGIVLDLHPNKLHVADVLINKTDVKVTIDQNGKVNVVETLAPADQKGEKGKENLIEQLVNFLLLQVKGPMPMSIDLVKLDNLAVDFTDGSISPSFKTRLEIAKSTMEGMSSDPSAQAEFKMEGNIDQSATINSAGQMNPLNAMQSAKLDFLLQGFKLTSVSPYSGKYMGYKIAEGALDLDLKYRVDGGKFTGDNIVIVDQLTLGDKENSPDATKLPVKMGIALLKGPDGRITLQVPVDGDVKDPQFDFGKAVTSSLTGAVDAASKSPYATIKDIDGFKGQELRFIEFELGLAEFSGPAKKKLKALAKVLRKNSELTLGIEGTADRQMDWPKMSGMQPKKERTVGKQKDAKTQQKGLAKDQAVDEDQLKKLALMRANEVKKYMMRWRRVPAERIQLKPARIISTTNKEYGQVELSLTVMNVGSGQSK